MDHACHLGLARRFRIPAVPSPALFSAGWRIADRSHGEVRVRRDMIRMLLPAAALALGWSATPAATAGPAPDAARYDAAGRLLFPAAYREWIFLSAGLDMRYTEGGAAPTAHVFDNVFAPRAAYAAFKATGHWPDGTVLILELRDGVSKGSINQAGHFQVAVAGVEAHVKDSRRFTGGWGFFAFQGGKRPNGSPTPPPATAAIRRMPRWIPRSCNSTPRCCRSRRRARRSAPPIWPRRKRRAGRSRLLPTMLSRPARRAAGQNSTSSSIISSGSTAAAAIQSIIGGHASIVAQ